MSTISKHASSFAAGYGPSQSSVQPAQTSYEIPESREYIVSPEDLPKLLNSYQKALQHERSVERSHWQQYADALGYNAKAKQAWLDTMRMSEPAVLPETPEILQTVYELLEKSLHTIVSTTNPGSVHDEYSMDKACDLLYKMEVEKQERKWRQQLYHLDINKALRFSDAGREEWWASIFLANPAEQVKKLDDGPATTIYELKLEGTV